MAFPLQFVVLLLAICITPASSSSPSPSPSPSPTSCSEPIKHLGCTITKYRHAHQYHPTPAHSLVTTFGTTTTSTQTFDCYGCELHLELRNRNDHAVPRTLDTVVVVTTPSSPSPASTSTVTIPTRTVFATVCASGEPVYFQDANAFNAPLGITPNIGSLEASSPQAIQDAWEKQPGVVTDEHGVPVSAHRFKEFPNHEGKVGETWNAKAEECG